MKNYGQKVKVPAPHKLLLIVKSTIRVTNLRSYSMMAVRRKGRIPSRESESSLRTPLSDCSMKLHNDHSQTPSAVQSQSSSISIPAPTNNRSTRKMNYHLTYRTISLHSSMLRIKVQTCQHRSEGGGELTKSQRSIPVASSTSCPTSKKD